MILLLGFTYVMVALNVLLLTENILKALFFPIYWIILIVKDLLSDFFGDRENQTWN